MRAKDLVVGSEYHVTRGWGRTQESTDRKCRVVDNRPIFRQVYETGAGYVIAEGGNMVIVELVDTGSQTVIAPRNIDRLWADYERERAQAAAAEAERTRANRVRIARNEALWDRIVVAAEARGVTQERLLFNVRASIGGEKVKGVAARGHMDIGLDVLAELLGVEP